MSGDKMTVNFFTQWNFPMCLGALDEKCVLIAKPHNTGSEYYDYKDNFSIIMMALVDANHEFLYVDVGAYGKASDGGVWNKYTLNSVIERNDINIPAPHNIPFTNRLSPYIIVGDETFPLKQNLMKPHPGHGQTLEQ
uniref:DDE Tnp4 domain-containing protein n=1 Tax=Scylla olivacea TaxID=85551 RepID=A0A0P4WI79_SCYOL